MYVLDTFRTDTHLNVSRTYMWLFTHTEMYTHTSKCIENIHVTPHNPSSWTMCYISNVCVWRHMNASSMWSLRCMCVPYIKGCWSMEIGSRRKCRRINKRDYLVECLRYLCSLGALYDIRVENLQNVFCYLLRVHIIVWVRLVVLIVQHIQLRSPSIVKRRSIIFFRFRTL